MPKQKTHKSVLKRVKITSTGKVMRRHQFSGGHLKRKKSKSALERAKRPHSVYKGDAKQLKKLLGI